MPRRQLPLNGPAAARGNGVRRARPPHAGGHSARSGCPPPAPGAERGLLRRATALALPVALVTAFPVPPVFPLGAALALLACRKARCTLRRRRSAPAAGGRSWPLALLLGGHLAALGALACLVSSRMPHLIAWVRLSPPVATLAASLAGR